MKKCNKCKLEKRFEEFTKDKSKKDGLHTQCKSCKKEWRNNNKEYYKEWNNNNKEYYKEWNNNNKEYYKEWRNNNKEKIKEYYKEWDNNNNKEKIKEYYENNKNKINYNKNQYQKNKRKSNPLFKLSTNIRTLINNIIKVKDYQKNTKTESILGCSFEEFKSYIESQFQPWMNWDNYGNPKDGVLEFNKTWDIDHIVPLASALNEEEVLKLNHYSNLQPLCSKTNRHIKRNRLL
jgi:hypothetical protein